jgi:hypothetical protein
MKIISTISILVLSTTFAFSQTISVSGTVSDQSGRPVPFAFVRDAQHNYATYADSTGTFVLQADPSSSLAVFANNFKKTDVKIDNKTSVKIVLPTVAADEVVRVVNSESAVGSPSGSFLQNRQMLVTTSGTAAPGQIIKEGFTQEATRGSRYLFEEWVPGFGVSNKDSLIVETTNLYNFDKLNGNLMYTNDGRSMAGISIQQIRTFTLYDRKGKKHVYENAPTVSDKPFIEVLVSTPRYKIYKKIDTKLKRADYHTDGVLEMGHRYDEFQDVERYYFVSGANPKPQSISLRKSALKKVFAGDADAFITSQGSRDVDDEYVKDLGNSLSK